MCVYVQTARPLTQSKKRCKAFNAYNRARAEVKALKYKKSKRKVREWRNEETSCTA